MRKIGISMVLVLLLKGMAFGESPALKFNA